MPPKEWIDEGERAIATAVSVLEEQEKEAKRKRGTTKSDQQLSG